MRRLFWRLVRAGCAGLIALLIGGWLQNWHPAFDSLSHFRLHFAGLLAFLGLFCIVGGHKIWALFSGLAVVVSLWLAAPYLPGMDQYSAKTNGATLQLVQMNLRFNNPEPGKAVEALRTAKADIILLQEVTRMTEGVLAAFQTTHPHQLSCQTNGIGSVAILSRFAFIQPYFGKCERFFGYASARVKIGDRSVSLASFHSRWPWPAGQKRQIDQLGSDFANLEHPLIVAGDFNAAPWSAVLQRVARETRTRVATGLKLTWAPRFVEFKARIGALLPLDQILTSPEFNINERTVLQDGGSDHFPVVTMLTLKP